MITDENIAALVDLFQTRKVMLYHACQLQDFSIYLELGGIPSRHRLERSNQEFTPFTTDNIDRVNGVWDKVFMNLSDFGRTFASGHGATPNTYGPILFVIDPTALLRANDVAITLRSAGAGDFNRDRESLSTVNQVDRLFVNPSDSRNITSTYIKYKQALQEDFKFPAATNPEINCSFPKDLLPLEYISSIVVDPYNFHDFGGDTLINVTFQTIKDYQLKCEVKKRNCSSYARVSLYNEILKTVCDNTPTFEQILSSEIASPGMKEWVQQMQRFNLEYQFIRFAKYLREGTFHPLMSMINC